MTFRKPFSTNAPIAYFLTFRTYGTWLHGDERGSVDLAHNQYGEPLLAPNERLMRRRGQELKHPPTLLHAAARACVDKALREVCANRRWTLEAIAVRSNHVHIVVTAGNTPAERAMGSLKSWATRRLREEGCFGTDVTIWGHHGSTRYLWAEDELERACEYVTNGQD